MIDVERVANAIENAAYASEHLDQEYPMKADAEAAIAVVVDMIAEWLSSSASIHSREAAKQLRNMSRKPT